MGIQWLLVAGYLFFNPFLIHFDHNFTSHPPHLSSPPDPLLFCFPTNAYIKAGQGNPGGGKGSQGQAKESGENPVPILRIPTRTPS